MTISSRHADTSELPEAPAPVPRPAPIGRRTAIIGLLVGSVLNLGEAVIGGLAGEGGTAADFMAAGEQHPALLLSAGVMGTLAVPFLVIGFLAMAHLVRPQMPRLAGATSVLAYAFGFGFFGIHVAMMIQYVAISHPDRAAMIDLMDAAQAHPAVGFLVILPFMLGALGAGVLASIGMLRTRVVPRGIPVLILVFLVLDFGQFSTGPVDPHWVFVAVEVWLAWRLRGMSDAQWWRGSGTTGATSSPSVTS